MLGCENPVHVPTPTLSPQTGTMELIQFLVMPMHFKGFTCRLSYFLAKALKKWKKNE